MIRTSWEEEEIRRSFEVVSLDDLPPDDLEVEIELAHAASCVCAWCSVDWLVIAEASIAILESGVDPLDSDAVHAMASELGLSGGERNWTESLFCPTEAIAVLKNTSYFTNGRHRTHVLRRAGVERAVVYTGRAEGSTTSD